MDIHKATEQAVKKSLLISRESWEKHACISLQGSSTLTLLIKDKSPCKGWQPTAKDLIAEDWVAVD